MKPPIKPTAVFFTALLIVCLLFGGCTTDQLNQVGRIAQPIADAAVGAAAAYYGLPPGSAQVIDAARDSLWGSAVKAWGRQTPATGAAHPVIGDAIQQALPVGATGAQAANLLETAARSLPATIVVPAGTPGTAGTTPTPLAK
jgi:hypothetical protein